MGIHFDTLVELVKKEIPKRGKVGKLDDGYAYLSNLIRRAHLFNLPFESREIRPVAGKEYNEFKDYIDSYIDLSHKNNQFLITPFPITAIEDKDTVVIFDNLAPESTDTNSTLYRVTMCFNKQPQGKKNIAFIIYDIEMKIDDSIKEWGMEPLPKYSLLLTNRTREEALITEDGFEVISPYEILSDNKLLKRKNNDNHLTDIITSSKSYIEEIVYIMDPANFIIEKEHKQSIKYNSKKRKNGKLNKTIMRPTYICLNKADTIRFLKSQSEDEIIIHPISTHPRTFKHERFVNMRDQTIEIKQHYQGAGVIEGKQGITYRVMLKTSPTTLEYFTTPENKANINKKLNKII